MEGKIVRAEEDLDQDGVVDSIDVCLDTPVGDLVTWDGCTIVPFDAIKVAATSESCVNSTDGEISIQPN